MGVLLVAGSVVVGTLLLGGDDPGVPVWQVRADLADGAPIDPADLQSVRVVLPAEAAGAYVSAASPLPADSVARRGVAAGELLPAGALERDGEGPALVPVPVGDEGIPGVIRPGSLVDVWVVPGEGALPSETSPLTSGAAERVLDDVAVVSLPTGVALGGDAPAPLVVGVDADAAVELGEVLAQLTTGRAVVVGQG
ncbi:hypothetical protein KLP28_10625 [Nocardioidaceae bacterium]|nr:hypothetical protein KLP28_10625 [Nocardioidaceae bacterium]